MAKFQFRLATLQKIREAHRDELRANLGEAYRAEQLLAEQVRAVRDEESMLETNRRQALQSTATDVNQLLNAQRYSAVLRSQLATMAEQSKMLATEVEKRRLALVEADQQVRALENLRERQLAVHEQGRRKAEAKVMDEIASRTQESNH